MHSRNLFRNGRFYLALFLALGLWLLVQPSPARAETITVTQTLDSGAGTLRQAIADAAPGDTIAFTGSMTITLSSQLGIAKNLTIDGGSYAITVSGNNAARVFNIGSGNVTLKHLNIVHGTAGEGGGIYNAGTLTVQNCTLSSNTATGGMNTGGGGIHNDGALTVRNSTLSGNAATNTGDGGGIYVDYGTLMLQNSTLSGNTASAGGGIQNYWGTVTLQNSTLANNTASWTGGGIHLFYGTLHYQNTLIADNTGGQNCKITYSGPIGTNVHNLVEDGSCSTGGVGFLSGDPLLGPLADNGGDTLTHALLTGSPAIDAGDDATCLATDQRGIKRPQNFSCDIGAYEAPTRLQLTKSVTPTSDISHHGSVTYTLTLSNTSLVSDTTARLTDTLPTAVDFGTWIENHGATVSPGDTITWQGSVSAGTYLTFTFTAAHIGDYAETVANQAMFSSGAAVSEVGSDTATFKVVCALTRSVQNANNSGTGSLRQAIADICAGGVITFASDTSINLDSELSINKSLTIDGHGHAVTVSGNNAARVFNIAAGNAVTLSHLSIVSGTATDGGGIYNAGDLTVLYSTIANNTASTNGGGIRNLGTLLIKNSTLSGNTAQYGGGINSTSPITLYNCTLSGNTGNINAGGNIRQWGGTLALYNTILANGDTAGDCIVSDASVIVANVHNMVEDGTCSAAFSGDPRLGPLADNGGDTWTHALLPGSPATERGDDVTCLTDDQRGVARPLMTHCDIGAVEAPEQPILVHLTKTVTPTVDIPEDGVVTYTLVVHNIGTENESQALVTDTLPYGMVFKQWVTPPSGAVADTNTITWTGALVVNTPLTLTFQATRTMAAAGAWVVNTAYYSGTIHTAEAMAQFKPTCADAITVQNGQDDGPGSLRDAIVGVCPGGTITFADDTTIYLNNTLNIAKSLTIDGSPYTVTVSGDSGNDGSRNVRAFDISDGTAVTLAHLHITHCYHSERGAGINNAGTLTVLGCNISNNSGSVIRNHEGALTVRDSILSNNNSGSAIDNYQGALTVRDSILSDNSASFGGGAIASHGNSGGNVVIQNSTLSGNSAPNQGGAIYYAQIAGGSGSLTVLSSTLTHNSSWYGGGIHARYVNLVVQNSVFAMNTAPYGGGGIYFHAENTYNPITVDNSTFVGNVGGTVWDAYARGGGGIFNYQGEMTIRNSTFSGNSAPENEGGAIVTWGTLTLLNSTLIGNSSRNDLHASGLANWGTLHIKNTLIASDSPNPDCKNYGTIVTNLNNLVEDGSCSAGGANFQTGDPRVKPLADNGGPRVGAGQDTPLQTHALLLGSPALDSGDAASCLTADQRGAPRPQGAGCDIGAYEVFRLVLSKSVTPTVDAPYHGIVTYTLTLSNTSPVSDTTVLLTDTLPAEVDFAGWVENHSATVSPDDTLTWSGVVTAGTQLTFTFTVTHTGDYNEMVVNTATFSGGAQWWASGADTATFTTECLPAHSVQNSNDSGPGSLRAAIAEVCSGGLITFNADVSITLSSELLLDKVLTIDGHGRTVTISGNDAVRVFNVAAGNAVTLSHFSIVSGTHSTHGGGIYNAGDLTVRHCTLADNTAGTNGGGIQNWNTLRVYNSTLSGNTAQYGGGINNGGGKLWLYNSTLISNTGNTSAGGGIRQWNGELYLYNTVLANNGVGGDCFVNDSNLILDNFHNLVEDGSCSANGVGFLSGDPLLGPLADNGGDTLTHALLTGSPAIDAGDPATCLATDQRGEPRPQGAACDIGAVESPPQPVVRIAKTVTPTLAAYHGVVTYTVTLTNTGALSDTRAQWTDALPDAVAFGGWIAQNGALEHNNAITWTGTLTSGISLTFSFTATHRATLQVANTAAFSGTAQQRQATATFNVACQPTSTVQNSNDSGPDSLRQGIADTCAGGYIGFAGDTTVYLNSTLAIAKALTIDGSGHAVTLSGDSGNDGTRDVHVLNIAAGHAVTLSHLSIVSGYSHFEWYGGGIHNAGHLTLLACTLADNDTIYGGGIYNTGRLTVTGCLFTNNNASYGGGIHNTGQVTAVNSTFSGNTAYEGGGIHSTGVMTLTHITLADNSASNANTGGGIRQAGGALYAYNTLIAHSGRGGDCYVDSDSIILANVNNWIADGTCSANGVNFRSGDPLLDPLGDNGGDTLTYALPVISPAVDAGDAAFCPPTDQRGKPRPVGAGCDIGAYELGPLHLTYTVTPTGDAPYHGLVTYTLALANTGSVDEAGLWLTATLPAEVIMAGWIVSPSNTTLNGNAVYWHGDLVSGEAITVTFLAQHTGEYADVVASEARFTGATDVGRAYNTFAVECAPAYQVTTAADSGLGSLRNALAGTCEGGYVSFVGDTTIYLSSTLTISKGVTVDGSGHAITISGDSGNDGSRDVTVFYVTAGNAVTLSHLSIVSGSATLYDYGGGIINMMGNLRLLDSTLTDNRAEFGGAVFNAGMLTMTRCTLLNNVAEIGGGMLIYGGILVMQNSTLSHNTAELTGGGIYNAIGAITLTHTTLSDNTVITGTGVGAGYHQEDENSTLYAYHTLIANSVVSGTAGGDCVIAGGVISASVNNLIEDGACGATLSGDPVLGPLQDNGGGTATRALLGGSPAIDAIPPVSCTLTMDQRGMPRPYPAGGACDIGAYEAYPALSLAKSVTPTTGLACHDIVTYILVFSNSGAVTETQAGLRDTLPPEVTFGAWIISPTGTLHAGNVITWNGALAAGATRTWRFTALHIGDYDEVITNTATFGGAQNGNAAATFSVMLTPTYSITPTWSAGGSITPGAPQARHPRRQSDLHPHTG